MTFEKISFDPDCDCLLKSEIDNESEFIRKLRKDKLEDKDFLSHWEREKRPEINDCEHICSFKGISINKFKKEYEELILEKYRTTSRFAPKKGSYYIKFKIAKNAGKIAYAAEDNDTSHYNFYKSDQFTLGNIVVAETVKFT